MGYGINSHGIGPGPGPVRDGMRAWRDGISHPGPAVSLQLTLLLDLIDLIIMSTSWLETKLQTIKKRKVKLAIICKKFPSTNLFIRHQNVTKTNKSDMAKSE
jgi:hypothetical protein